MGKSKTPGGREVAASKYGFENLDNSHTTKKTEKNYKNPYIVKREDIEKSR